jgi:hypothetical protein
MQLPSLQSCLVQLTVAGSAVASSDLVTPATKCPQLKHVSLSKCAFTDLAAAGAARLFRSLTSLHLSGANVNCATMLALLRLPHPSALAACRPQVSYAGAAALCGCKGQADTSKQVTSASTEAGSLDWDTDTLLALDVSNCAGNDDDIAVRPSAVAEAAVCAFRTVLPEGCRAAMRKADAYGSSFCTPLAIADPFFLSTSCAHAFQSPAPMLTVNSMGAGDHHCPRLQALGLAGTAAVQSTLHGIHQQCTHLQDLNMLQCEAVRNAYVPLVGLTTLSSLQFSSAKCAPQHVQALLSMPRVLHLPSSASRCGKPSSGAHQRPQSASHLLAAKCSAIGLDGNCTYKMNRSVGLRSVSLGKLGSQRLGEIGAPLRA